MVAETTTTAPDAPRSDSGSSGSNAFSRKVGPLPLWAWMGIGLAVALGFYFWRQNLGKSNATQTSASPDQTEAASQIPQFVNQTFVTGQPPTAPPPPVVGTQPPRGTATYRTTGKETLADIAKKLKVTPQVLIADTIDHPGNVNGGKFVAWLKTSKMGATGKVPKGLDLFYGPGEK